jgi:polyferredoxin
MDKMGYARGLVKYSTQHAINLGWNRAQMLRHVLRPRVLIYTAILASIVIALFTSLLMRDSFRVDVVRDRGVMARIAEGGMLENVYRLQIMNATETTQRYELSASGIDKLKVESDVADANKTVTVNSAESRWIPVRLQIPDGSVKSGSHPVEFNVRAVESNELVAEKSVFLVPR